MRNLLVILLLFSGLVDAPAGATVLLPADLGDLSREAYAIVRGRVVAVDTQWTSPARRSIETLVTLEADVWLKRDLGGTIRFRVPGGRLGRYQNIVAGAPRFATGQHVVVFLGAAPPQLPFILGLSQGLFRISAQGSPVVSPPPVLPASGPASKIVRGDLTRMPMALGEFERRVRTLASGAQ